MASCRMARALSSILSNSSMQQSPRSESTSAPLSSTSSLVTGSLLIVAVRPTALLPLPEVYTPLGATLYENCRSCDFAVEGSPQSNVLISGRQRPLLLCETGLGVPPNSWERRPFLTSSSSKIEGAKDFTSFSKTVDF